MSAAAPPRLALELEHGRTAFEPGGRVAGVAGWSAAPPVRGIELRLSWALEGRGGRDWKIAQTLALPAPQPAERRPFLLTLPLAPYSFEGSLLRLTWMLELVALPGEEKTGVGLVVAPGNQVIDLRRATARL